MRIIIFVFKIWDFKVIEDVLSENHTVNNFDENKRLRLYSCW